MNYYIFMINQNATKNLKNRMHYWADYNDNDLFGVVLAKSIDNGEIFFRFELCKDEKTKFSSKEEAEKALKQYCKLKNYAINIFHILSDDDLTVQNILK